MNLPPPTPRHARRLRIATGNRAVLSPPGTGPLAKPATALDNGRNPLESMASDPGSPHDTVQRKPTAVVQGASG